MSSSHIRAFLSHSDKDKKIATDLKETLAKHGIDVFLAHTDLESGTEWESKLFSEIQGSVIKAWTDPRRRERRTIHHNGDGTFVVDGRTIDLRTKMIKWPDFV